VSAVEAVYGAPPPALAVAALGAAQISPIIVDSTPVETLADDSLTRIVLQAPPGVLERRYALAHALRALAPGGEIIALAPKTKGGARLSGELASFGCVVAETAKRHHRVCRADRPAAPSGLDEAIAAGAPRLHPGLGLWTQPGVFSWDRIDPGTALLTEHLADLSGTGADLGCGVGVLARRVLARPAVSRLWAVDIDRRATEAAKRNLEDPRAHILQADARNLGTTVPDGLDFVVMNPPFHDGGQEDRGLGLAFVDAAASRLRKGGVCRLVVNVALSYEARLNSLFGAVRLMVQAGGYKVYEARR
jgi:16S rRNA (guanine1207-N2)-methyltransferase